MAHRGTAGPIHLHSTNSADYGASPRAAHRRRQRGGPLGPSPPQPPSPETARLVMRAGGASWHALHYISRISLHVLPSISSEALYMISMYFNHLSATLPQSGGSCTRMHFYGCFCTCGRVAIQCYEQYRPSRLILVHDPPDRHHRRATARRGGYDRAGSGGLGPSGPPPRHARCQRWKPPEVHRSDRRG